MLLNAQVSDDSGTLDVVSFSGETELIFGMKADQIVALKLDVSVYAHLTILKCILVGICIVHRVVNELKSLLNLTCAF